MMLVLQNFGYALAGSFLDVSVATLDELDQNWHQLLMDLRHVEQVNDFFKIFNQLGVLSPGSVELTYKVIAYLFPSEARQVDHKDHKSLE